MTSAAASSILKRELELKVEKEYFWTDSKVVLGYVNYEAKKFRADLHGRPSANERPNALRGARL